MPGGNIRNSRCTHPNKTRRQEEAQKRLRFHRTPKEQIAWLDNCDYVAKKERAKLQKQL